MSWNYRIMTNGGDEPYFEIHEVYYTKKGEPRNYTANAITIGSEEAHDILDILDKMRDAHRKPILLKGDLFPQEYGYLKSRCCGRCDGVHDECVADMKCDEHKVLGCEECFGTSFKLVKE